MESLEDRKLMTTVTELGGTAITGDAVTVSGHAKVCTSYDNAHDSSRSNNGIVGGGGGTDMDVLGRRWRGDANRDGVVTGTDLIVVQQNFGLSVALDGPLDGDANNDGQVTGMDLIEVQQTFGQVTGNAIVGSGLSNGSIIVGDNHFIGPLGGDGVFSVHNNTFGQVESTDAAVVAAVPEPATIALISAGLLFMRKTRRTR